MIEGLKPYPKMKDSGVTWLGEVPEHWDVRRLGASVHGVINGVWGNEPNGTDDLPCIRVADFDRARLRVRVSRPTLRAIPPREREGRLLEKNDLLLEKSGGGELQPVGIVMLYDHSVAAVCSNFVARLPAEVGYDPSYLTYLHSHLYSIRLNTRSIKQTTGIQNLDSSAYLSEVVAFPPSSEQAAIAQFLDHAERRIRGYIRAKQKLIKLLQEQKQAIIHRAVTRGLDPNVRLKSTGVQWLGDVPEHWEVSQLRRLVSAGRRITYGIVQPGEPDPHGRFMVRGQDYSFGWAGPESVFRVSNAIESPYKRSRLAAGDLVLTIVGAGVGNVALVPPWLDGANITQTSARISLDPEKAEPQFIAVTLEGPIGRRSVEFYVKGAAQPGLNLEHVRLFLVPVPPLQEQREIVSAIADQTSPIRIAIDRGLREVSLLREYRTRLIADVVTGKLNVREAGPRPCDEIAELAPAGVADPGSDYEDGMDDQSDPDLEAIEA